MRYSTTEGKEDGFQLIRLRDEQSDLAAEILPGVGNNTFSLKKANRNFLWRPDLNLSALVQRKALFGIPFLAPWANRLESSSYWVNGARFSLNLDLGNLRFDHNQQPIHGLLLFERWTVDQVEASDAGAHVLSSFAFARHPKLTAQFPFAHRLEMKHTLSDGRLHVAVKVISECDEPIPVSLGFHPYFTIPESNRNEWDIRLPARQHVLLNEKNIPTGKIAPVGQLSVEVKTTELDDVYSDLLRDGDGYARFLLRSHQARVGVGFGPKYPVGVVYAPRTGNFVCMEPMAAVTNALNSSRNGADHGLQSIAPGGSWEEEFWIEPVIA